jgi:hypothetical protein
MDDELTKEQILIHELIFGNKSENEIHIFEYIQNVNDISSFTEKILLILEKSGITIKEEILILTEFKNIWILKLKK